MQLLFQRLHVGMQRSPVGVFALRSRLRTGLLEGDDANASLPPPSGSGSTISLTGRLRPSILIAMFSVHDRLLPVAYAGCRAASEPPAAAALRTIPNRFRLAVPGEGSR